MTVMPDSPTELHPGDTHPTAGSMHEKRFAGRGMTAVKERLIGSSIGHEHGGPLGERRLFAKRMHLFLFAQGLFGVRTAERTGQIHPVTHGNPVHALAYGLDDASAVRAGREGRRRLGIDTGPNIGLNRIDSDRVHTHHDLTRPRGQVRDFFELQYLWFTKLVYPNSFHGVDSLPRRFAII